LEFSKKSVDFEKLLGSECAAEYLSLLSLARLVCGVMRLAVGAASGD
jgi:hypothetical protein